MIESELQSTIFLNQSQTSYASQAEILIQDPAQDFDVDYEQQIGRGAYGKVFKATRIHDQRACALKKCSPSNFRERNTLLNEIGMMNHCKEANEVVKVLASYEFEQNIWIFLELMDGDLTGLIENYYQTYSETVVKYILRKVLEGLAHLHSLGIIHRDIKSDNVLIDRQGQVKLADFGFSCRLPDPHAVSRKSEVGTAAWMAPELLRAAKPGYGTSIDIWSFGILAIELANGEPPNLGKPIGYIAYQLLNGPPPVLNERWSPEFQSFVNTCLVKDPAERQNAEQLLEHDFLKDAVTEESSVEICTLFSEHIETNVLTVTKYISLGSSISELLSKGEE